MKGGVTFRQGRRWVAGIVGLSTTNVATKISRIKHQLQRDHHAGHLEATRR